MIKALVLAFFKKPGRFDFLGDEIFVLQHDNYSIRKLFFVLINLLSLDVLLDRARGLISNAVSQFDLLPNVGATYFYQRRIDSQLPNGFHLFFVCQWGQFFQIDFSLARTWHD